MSKSKILRSTLIIMVVSVFSRSLGFIRDLLIAANFGTGINTDSYNIAVTIPETLFMVIGLAISTSFLPVLSEQLIKNGKEEMYNFANRFITLLLIISVGVFVLAIIFAEQIVPIFARGFSGQKLVLTIFLTRITVFNLLFLAVNACFSAMLQVNEDFIVPSILGLFFNTPIILYLLLFHSYSIIGLTIANVAGNLIRVLVQIPPLIKHGYKFKLNFNLKDPRVKKVLILIIPVIIGAGANSLNVVVDKTIASSLKTGSVSALDFAQKLVVFLNTIITSSILTVTYPLIANKRNSGDSQALIEYIKKTIIYTLLLLIPISIGAIIFSQDIIKIVYMRGAFTQDSVDLTTLAFIGYLIGLAFYGLRDILNSALFAMNKTVDTTVNGIIGVTINIILNLSLSKIFGILGIAIATSSSLIITSVLLLFNLKRVINEFNLRLIFFKILKIICASVIIGLLIVIFNNLVRIEINLGIILIVTGLAAIIYYFLCLLFRINEIKEITSILRKFGRC
ncbi:MAG: murein biosynthesis integral membrane protein MurJ [Desulfitobacteriaceae bacterium]|nr:murein biosynthesis integral membrane protein MurJ [Desulfitobacteriaceae bacterium]MDD4345286.1 murein biosynthesis integral membrane protein MurJ [Desulfitobacteriaceae bacterium]MDD4400468.1 murein biosynthesis integral membrane protein MurJ [Desulfitobacteriaceae bacterium]